MDTATDVWSEYRERIATATDLDRSRRVDAWLNLPSKICGVIVYPITVRKMLILESCDSPVLKGESIEGKDARVFLWVCSQEFELCPKKAKAFQGKIKLDETLGDDLQAFLDDTFKLSAGDDSARNDAEHFASALFDLVGGEYGWTIDNMMDMPMAQMLQLVASITRRFQMKSGASTISFNPEVDRIKAEYLTRMNAPKHTDRN
tara:strand:- start:187 stop:798 length:612 start_codon:yes stop_codon:yes gene_type:complete